MASNKLEFRGKTYVDGTTDSSGGWGTAVDNMVKELEDKLKEAEEKIEELEKQLEVPTEVVVGEKDIVKGHCKRKGIWVNLDKVHHMIKDALFHAGACDCDSCYHVYDNLEDTEPQFRPNPVPVEQSEKEVEEPENLADKWEQLYGDKILE